MTTRVCALCRHEEAVHDDLGCLACRAERPQGIACVDFFDSAMLQQEEEEC